MDFFGLTEAVYADATTNGGAVYGITNATAPCIAPVAPTLYFFPGSTDINGGVSSFSDDPHPSALSHRFIGQLALATVPEPGTLALVVLAVVGVARQRRRVAVRARAALA